MSINKDSKKAPDLRFKGFTDDWEQRKVKEIAKETFGGGTPNTRIEKYWNGDFPWIQSSDLKLNNLHEVIPTKFITKDAIKNSATKIVPKNSIAIVTRVGVGKLAFIQYSYSTSQDFLSLSLLNTDTLFALYSLYRILQKEIKNIQGTSIKGITKSDLLSKDIHLSPLASEQIKIGRFMNKIDNTITLHQRKLDQLKQLKEALLQQMFPGKGETVPRLRFAGFEGDWEERKLDDLLNKNTEKNKDLSVINVESVSNKTGFTKQTEQFEDYSVASADLSNYYVIRECQFAYNPSRINVGSIAYKALGDDTAVVSPLYVSFSTKKGLHDGFIWNWFKTPLFDAQRQRLSEGGVRDTLSFNQLSEMDIIFPEYLEQEKVSEIIKQLDNTITLQQRKLDQLKNTKQVLLENMFI